MAQLVAEAETRVRPEWSPLLRARIEFARYRWLGRVGRLEESLAAAERQAAICAEGGLELGALYAMSNVVGGENQLGRHEIALAHAKEAIARLDALGAGAGAGHLWMGVMSAELMLGRIQEGLAAGRRAYALLLREGDELRTFSGFALAAAQSGALADAARIIGYADAVSERAGVIPGRTELSSIKALLSILESGLTADEIARYRAEGAAMREEDAVKLAGANAP